MFVRSLGVLLLLLCTEQLNALSESRFLILKRHPARADSQNRLADARPL